MTERVERIQAACKWLNERTGSRWRHGTDLSESWLENVTYRTRRPLFAESRDSMALLLNACNPHELNRIHRHLHRAWVDASEERLVYGAWLITAPPGVLFDAWCAVVLGEEQS